MKIVFTWWSYSWKFDLLNKLKCKWYNIKSEVVSTNIDLLIYLLWMEWYKNWRKENFLRFQEMNIFKNLERDIYLSETKTHFLDRWVFDFFASLKRENIEVTPELEKLSEKIYYDKIIFLEEIPFLDKLQEWRLLDKKQSKLWWKLIKQEYIDRFWEENIIEVPFFWEKDLDSENNLRIEFIEHELENII